MTYKELGEKQATVLVLLQKMDYVYYWSDVFAECFVKIIQASVWAQNKLSIFGFADKKQTYYAVQCSEKNQHISKSSAIVK